MKDAECVEFLQWALPRVRMRWAGFRKVRGQVCKRIARRITELGVRTPNYYRRYLEANSEEWSVLEKLCRVTISRFYRDRGTFEQLGRDLLPRIARAASASGEQILHAWCVGCASGEEPYSLALLWEFLVKPDAPGMELRITASDSDPVMLDRAEKGCYPHSSVRELPKSWLEKAFTVSGGDYCLRGEFRGGIEFVEHDVRREVPLGSFHLVLCRNLVFTYFDENLQGDCLKKIVDKLLPGGALVIGGHESLPPHAKLEKYGKSASVYIKKSG